LGGFGFSPGGARNNYIGTTLINEGTLSYSGINGLSVIPTSFAPNYWTLSNGAVLQLDLNSTGSTFFGSGNVGIRLAGGGAISVTEDNTWVYNSQISGSGDLAKLGTGTLTLTSLTLSIDGALRPNEGTLLIAGAVTARRLLGTGGLQVNGLLN